MKCQDCGEKLPMAANASHNGWLFFSDDSTMCPICVRLATVEKHLQECEHQIEPASKDFKYLLSTFGVAKTHVESDIDITPPPIKEEKNECQL